MNHILSNYQPTSWFAHYVSGVSYVKTLRILQKTNHKISDNNHQQMATSKPMFHHSGIHTRYNGSAKILL